MKRYFYFLHSIALAGAVLSTAAVADNYKGPPQGEFTSLGGQYVICDTKEEIAEIAIAGEKSHDGLIAKVREYVELKNDKGESTCIVSPLNTMAFGEHIALPDTIDPNGKVANVWAVHIGNSKGEAWILWGQKPPDSI